MGFHMESAPPQKKNEIQKLLYTNRIVHSCMMAFKPKAVNEMTTFMIKKEGQAISFK